jgi:O-acetyl-ADP-ribose deacetylase (regulator of RNase III)
MGQEKKINNSTVHLLRGDIADLEIEAFVYYAREDLALGSGFGGAIAVRGGPTVQEELNKLAPVKLTEAVITAAGEMKADNIIHAVGPKFQEENLEAKLRATILNALKLADEKHLKRIAFPPMGTGFYGVPLELSAAVMFEVFAEYLSGNTGIEEVIICLMDSREYASFATRLSAAAVY